MKSKLRIILFAGIFCFAAVCTWSDYYYSKLERDYTVLMDFHNIGGFITDLRVRGKYSYLTIDSVERFLILPTRDERHDTQEFSELVDVGDLIHKGKNPTKSTSKKAVLLINSETMTGINRVPSLLTVVSFLIIVASLSLPTCNTNWRGSLV